MSEPSSPPSPRSRADQLLAAVVLAFAFLAASFTARNSDVWLHLAAGRLVATGEYSFGTDPFSFLTAGRYWANHAWLTDLGMYLTFTNLGGAALVLAKAAGVAALAALMLVAGRGRGPFWVAAGCVLLGILAASPRLLLQPACLSLVLLGFTLVLLHRERGARFLPLVFAAWVNLDGWFVLGLLLVGLWRLGRGSNLPPWLFPLCVGACLLSPHHVRAFTLPPELSPAVWGSEFRDDPRFAAFFAHPWRGGEWNLPAWAFFALVGLSTASFLVNRRASLGARLTWLAFLALAAWNVRLVPFFAVVAAPITAMNFRERLAPGFMNRSGRALTLMGGLALAFLAWQGALQGLRPGDRGMAFAVHTDPTLERVASALPKWVAVPGSGPVFATHPDVAHYTAWFAQGMKTTVDSRLNLFAHAGRDFRLMAQQAARQSASAADAERGRQLLADAGVRFVIVYDPDPRRLAPVLRAVSAPEHVGPRFRIEGAAVVVDRTDGMGLPTPLFRAGRGAFGPPDDQYPRAGDDPPRFGRPFSWWDFSPARGRKGSWEADAAGTYLRMFEESRAAGTSGDAPDATALPLLAVRAARRGTATDPDDATAWVVLGRAYLHLSASRAEAADAAAFTLLREVRQIQTVTALAQAAALNPDSAATHELLASVFAQKRLFDLALKHGEANLRLVRRAGPLSGETAEAFADRVARLTEIVARVEAAVQDGENRFVVTTQTLAGNPLARARIAVQLGLGTKAIDTLLKSHLDLYGLEGLRMLLELLLHTGQAEEARVLLDRDELRRNPAGLGFTELAGGGPNARWAYRLQAYGWFDLCQSAAAGKTGAAQVALERLRADFQPEEERLGRSMLRLFAQQLGSETGLAAPPATLFARLLASRERDQLAAQLARVRFLSAQRADLHTLGGLLLLEAGDAAAARVQFGLAAAVYAREQDVAPAVPGKPLAARYTQAIDAAGPR